MTYRDDLELISLSKEKDVKAQVELWKKWETFTRKQYMKSKEVFDKEGLTIDDYMQEAYFMFLSAVDGFDISKAKERGISSFSTYYYFYLLKLKTDTERKLSKLGPIATQSEFVCEDKDSTLYSEDAYCSAWNRAVSCDISDDFRREQAREIIDAYLSEEEDEVSKIIIQLLLEENTMASILRALNGEYSRVRLKRKVDNIYKKIRKIADRIAFETILA